MKWKTPKSGDKRIVSKFLLFPREINNEVRWLEKVKIEQEYDRGCLLGWWDIKWADSKQ